MKSKEPNVLSLVCDSIYTLSLCDSIYDTVSVGVFCANEGHLCLLEIVVQDVIVGFRAYFTN